MTSNLDHINPYDHFFYAKKEPLQSCLLGLNDIIVSTDPSIATLWKYKMPYYTYKGKNLCYLWLDKKTECPYVGFYYGKDISHEQLKANGRKQVKIIPIRSCEVLPIESIQECIQLSVHHIQQIVSSSVEH